MRHEERSFLKHTVSVSHVSVSDKAEIQDFCTFVPDLWNFMEPVVKSDLPLDRVLSFGNRSGISEDTV